MFLTTDSLNFGTCKYLKNKKNCFFYVKMFKIDSNSKEPQRTENKSFWNLLMVDFREHTSTVMKVFLIQIL